MNAIEYDRLLQVEQDHWFYSGKRAIVRHWIDRYHPLRPSDVLVDAGAGTGTFVIEMARVCHAIGIDSFEESIAMAAPRIGAAGGQLIRSSIESIDLPDATATVVTALDVLEHLDHDRAAFLELVRITKPGGLVVITVPALMALWSDWDVALHHRRRYTKSQLLKLIVSPDVRLLHCAYTNSLVLPAIAGVRMVRKFGIGSGATGRLEDVVPPAWINNLLYGLFVRTACAAWFQPPAGVSLLAVLTRIG